MSGSWTETGGTESAQRILILGAPGSGKSTLARRLGAQLDLPVCHLDQLFWKPGWVMAAPEDFDQALSEWLARPAWIIEGEYLRTLPVRLAHADLVIVAEVGPVRSLWNVLKRTARYWGRTRPDMNANCPERIDWDFIRYIWRYPTDKRPEREKELAGFTGRIHRLGGMRELSQL